MRLCQYKDVTAATFKLLYKVIVPTCLCKRGSCSRDGLPRASAPSSSDLEEGSVGKLACLGWFDVEASVGQSGRTWEKALEGQDKGKLLPIARGQG